MTCICCHLESNSWGGSCILSYFFFAAGPVRNAPERSWHASGPIFRPNRRFWTRFGPFLMICARTDILGGTWTSRTGPGTGYLPPAQQEKAILFFDSEGVRSKIGIFLFVRKKVWAGPGPPGQSLAWYLSSLPTPGGRDSGRLGLGVRSPRRRKISISFFRAA